LGAKIYQVIKTGAAVPTFRYEAGNASHSVYSVSVVPMRAAEGEANAIGTSALLVMEERTQAEQLQQLELEAANLRLVNNMADRLAAEIGNAIVPLSVHYQLFEQRIKEAEFRKSLKTALGDGVKRVDRLANQMRFIYGNSNTKSEITALGELLDEADEEAKTYFAGKSAALDCEGGIRSATVAGTRGALKHSFSEIILNGYQANASDAKVEVRLIEGSRHNGIEEVGIEFKDHGEGFSEEVAKKAPGPFYTNRTVGVGLGLSAVRKIIEDHGGRLEIPNGQGTKGGLVRIFLPAKPPQE
jgi:two-component system phosphoglycerate transport system sensor histidine kinase PgtB